MKLETMVMAKDSIFYLQSQVIYLCFLFIIFFLLINFIIFINRAPIIWYSKAQTTVESSTFSSEFIALKTCTEHISALRYKLRMFGVPIDGPTDVLCDNQSVVTNSTLIDSSLNKKHCSIAYHACRWAVAAEMMRLGKIHTDYNISDPLTKRLSVEKRDFLFGSWTY